jgi:hypothetical protein
MGNWLLYDIYESANQVALTYTAHHDNAKYPWDWPRFCSLLLITVIFFNDPVVHAICRR